MDDDTVLRLPELRHALDQLLTAAERQLGTDVVLPDDPYWHLPVDAAFDLTEEPRDLTVGRLTDDLRSLADPRDGEAWALWHDLGHAVGLLRALEMLTRP